MEERTTRDDVQNNQAQRVPVNHHVAVAMTVAMTVTMTVTVTVIVIVIHRQQVL